MPQPRRTQAARLTSRQIAALSGVSQTTVSRVLADHPNVSADTRRRVLDVLAETGYAPNTAARAMRTGTTGAIGVVVGRMMNPFYPELSEALHRELSRRRRTMSMWISDGGEDDSGELAALAAVRERAIDGVIYTTATARSESLHAAIEVGAPVVLLNRTIARLPCDSVATRNRAGGAAVARHLLALGHRRLALVAGPTSVSTSRERETGFREELRRQGIELEQIARDEFTHDTGRAAVATFDPRRRPTAVFCVSDVMAYGVLDEARAAGIAVPEALSVVGYDDASMSSWPGFALTTVRQPMQEMAALGIQRLLERIADPDLTPRRDRLEGELIVRGSTAAPPG